jgi:hypothetical protein
MVEICRRKGKSRASHAIAQNVLAFTRLVELGALQLSVALFRLEWIELLRSRVAPSAGDMA